MKTAILIDGGFFLRRYKNIEGFERSDSAEVVAKNLVSYCFKHIQKINSYRTKYKLRPTDLYRIYYYDAKPFEGDSQHPISHKPISFKKTDQMKNRNRN